MSDLAKRLQAAQMKDVHEMAEIFAAVEAGADPAEACGEIVGGSFSLCRSTEEAIKLGEDLRDEDPA